MKRLILPILAVAVLTGTIVANVPQPSTADPVAQSGAGTPDAKGAMHRGGHGGGFGRGMGGPYSRLLRDGKLADQLKLTTTQKARLKVIAEEHQRKAIQMRADADLARLDLGKLMKDERPDRNRINSQIDVVTKMRAEQMKSAIGAGLDAREVLTAEQRKQLEDLRGSWRGGERGGRGMKGGPGGRGPDGRGTQGSGSQELGSDDSNRTDS